MFKNHSSHFFRIELFCILLLTALCFFCARGEKPVSTKNIKSAENLIGLTFTEVERDSMLDELKENLSCYQEIHQFQLENAVPPALFFNPIPVLMKFMYQQKPFIISNYSTVKLPVNRDDLAFYTVGELAFLIKSRKISSVELTQFFLDRLKKFGPKLECVITLTEPRALKQAQQADAELKAGRYRGLLHGIPYGIKDLFAAKGYKTTWGAMPYKEQMPDDDATVVERLTAAGAVLVAKLSMGALAWGDVWFGGKTRNPWDTTQGSSGSSAGSAAAVAAGLVPFAIGTETWGSIVSPSTVCGTTGLRPTYGRISRAGAMALSWSMDKIGPITRSVEDCAIVFTFIYGPDGKDQTVYDLPFNYQPGINLKGLKIGYLKDDFDKQYDFKKQDSLALETLKSLGARLIPIKLPAIPVSKLSFLLSAEAAAAFDELTRSGKDDLMVRQIKNAWPNIFRASRLIPAVEYINANRIRHLLIQQMAQLMDSIDLYVAPSWEGDNLLLTNLSGHPCVVVPNGFSEKGTPTSISFIGRLFEEGKLLAVAKKFQDNTDFHRKHPRLN